MLVVFVCLGRFHLSRKASSMRLFPVINLIVRLVTAPVGGFIETEMLLPGPVPHVLCILTVKV